MNLLCCVPRFPFGRRLKLCSGNWFFYMFDKLISKSAVGFLGRSRNDVMPSMFEVSLLEVPS